MKKLYSSKSRGLPLVKLFFKTRKVCKHPTPKHFENIQCALFVFIPEDKCIALSTVFIPPTFNLRAQVTYTFPTMG